MFWFAKRFFSENAIIKLGITKRDLDNTLSKYYILVEFTKGESPKTQTVKKRHHKKRERGKCVKQTPRKKNLSYNHHSPA